MHRGLICSILLSSMVAGPGWAAQENTEPAEKSEKTEKWDIGNPPGERREIEIDVREGTWMSLDVSPDGQTIVFDLLGDIYSLPIGGGEAKALTSGLSWDIQPRFSPDGQSIAYISDASGGDNVWLMDKDGGNTRAFTKENFRLLGNPAWSPDGQFIAARKNFTTTRSLGTGEIWLYHINGGEGAALVKRPNEGHQKELGEPEFSPDGRYIYYARNVTSGGTFEYSQDSNTELFRISRYDRETGETTDIVRGPGGAVRPEVSPDGKKLTFVRRIRTKPALFIKDLSSGEERAIYTKLDRDMQETWGSHGVYPNMSWLADNETILFWAGGKIMRLNTASGEASEIPFHVKDTRSVVVAPRTKIEVAPATFETQMIRWASVAPAGDRVVYEQLGKLYVKNLPDGAPKRLTSDDENTRELYPSFSRDGQWVVYVSWDDEKLGEIRKVRARGGRSEAVTREPGHYADPSFSPDGKTIVYDKGRGGGLVSPLWSADPGIYAIPAGGGAARLITEEGGAPHFGASNDRIFITRNKDGKSRLVSIDLSGGGERVAAVSQWAREMRISPDGRHVATQENYHIFLMPLPGDAAAIDMGLKSGAMPVKRMSKDGGAYANWSANGAMLHWSTGAALFSANVAETLAGDAKVAQTEAPIDLAMEVKAAQPSGSVALVGARVVTMNDKDSVIEDGVIVIDGNRITAIGKRGDVAIPANAKQVEVAGKTIIPGLIDAHAHGPHAAGDVVPQQNLNSYATLAFGVTTIHDPSNSATNIFAAAELQRAGKIIAPRIYSTGNIIYGAKSGGWAPIDSYDDALGHVRRLKAQGAISVKNYMQPRREQRQQVVAAARAENMLVVPEGGSLYHLDMNLIADGNSSIEHAVPLGDLYEDVLQFWSATETAYVTTLSVAYGGIWGENYWYQHMNVWEHPILSRYVPPAQLEPRSVRRIMAPEEDYAHDDTAAAAKKLADRGVMVTTGAHGQREGLATHWEIWMMAQGGMPPMQALATATRLPAKHLGMEEDIGSLEEGKLADLVVLDANPLDDIRQSDKVHMVMLNGRLYESATLNEVATGNHQNRPFYWQR